RDGGRLEIRVDCADERLHIQLRNDGPVEAPVGATGSMAVGLRNVRERLQHLYAGQHAFALSLAEDGSCQVIIELPLRRIPAALAIPA
ncbi:MAG: hypothetical protein ABUL45_05145, partial [Rhodanobacter sp.]